MSETKGRRKALEEIIIGRAQEDSEFRRALLLDPKSVIEKELKMSVPPGIEIEVLEEQPNRFYMVLPVDPESVELPDEMLKTVAGGPCGSHGGTCC